MNTSLISTEDIEYLAGQSAQNMNMILSGMTMLMDENNEKTAMLESQTWFQRMSSTITGKNKMTLAEIQQNHDKINLYMTQAMSELFERSCIDQQIMMGLGMRLNDLYADHLQLKQMLGAFADKLNQKIISIDNFHMLETEIEQGLYSSSAPLAAMCKILSQLDTRTLNDGRKLDIIERSMRENGIISGEPVSISEYLMQLLNTDDREIGIIYMELGILGDNFIAGIFRNVIESYHFLPKTARMMKKKELVAESVIQQNQLDASAELSLEDIYREFLESMITKASRIGIPGETNDAGIESLDEELQEIVNDFLKYPSEETVEYLKRAGCEDGWELYMASICYEFIPPDIMPSFAVECSERGYIKGNLLASVRYAQKCGDAGKAEKIIHDNIGKLKKMAMQGNVFAMYEYAMLCSESSEFNLKEDGVDVRELLGKAADQGYWLAKFQLAKGYREEIDGEDDDEKAYRLFVELDKLGMPLATCALGDFYFCGLFVKEDDKKAAKLYAKAAEAGDLEAEYHLADCYRHGWGVAKDEEKAKELYESCCLNPYFYDTYTRDKLNCEFIVRPNDIYRAVNNALFEMSLEEGEGDHSYLEEAAKGGDVNALYSHAKCLARVDTTLVDYADYHFEEAKYCLEEAKKLTDSKKMLAIIEQLARKIIELEKTA